MKPFLKWAGGKYRIVDKIKSALPKGKSLIEPFAGSAAVFLNAQYEENIVADSNLDLISLYKSLQSGGEDFIQLSKKVFLDKNNSKEVFYTFRDEFNTTTDLIRKSVLFIYLNRHCFNGLCRYNSKGKFNVPFGRYEKPYFPENEMRFFYQKSKQATFYCADFRETMLKAKRGAVVYCDPPYVPLSKTASFTDYTKAGFGLEQQQALADLAEELQAKGVAVVISNHNTAFTRRAYKTAKVHRFDVQRFISSDGNNRGLVSELLAIYE